MIETYQERIITATGYWQLNYFLKTTLQNRTNSTRGQNHRKSDQRYIYEMVNKTLRLLPQNQPQWEWDALISKLILDELCSTCSTLNSLVPVWCSKMTFLRMRSKQNMPSTSTTTTKRRKPPLKNWPPINVSSSQCETSRPRPRHLSEVILCVYRTERASARVSCFNVWAVVSLSWAHISCGALRRDQRWDAKQWLCANVETGGTHAWISYKTMLVNIVVCCLFLCASTMGGLFCVCACTA